MTLEMALERLLSQAACPLRPRELMAQLFWSALEPSVEELARCVALSQTLIGYPFGPSIGLQAWGEAGWRQACRCHWPEVVEQVLPGCVQRVDQQRLLLLREEVVHGSLVLGDQMVYARTTFLGHAAGLAFRTA